MIEGRGDSPQYALDHLDPARLRKAREREGLTGKDLADKIQKSASAVSQFEAGVVKPDLSTLLRISMALGVPTIYFTNKAARSSKTTIPFDACHFRAKRKVSQKARRASIRAGEDILEIVDVVSDYGINFPTEELTSFLSGRRRPAAYDPREIEEIASSLREHWGLGMGPITNLVHLLESKGIFVLPLSEAHQDVDAYSVWAAGRPCIMLALQKTVARARFDAAHELGHLVLHDDTHPVGLKTTEDDANRFAGAFNAPRESFFQECPTRWNLDAFLRLKSRWHMSIGALVRRGYDLGRLSERSYRRAFQHLNSIGAREFEPGDDLLSHERPTMLTQALNLLLDEVDTDSLASSLSTHPWRVVDALKPVVEPETIHQLTAEEADQAVVTPLITKAGPSEASIESTLPKATRNTAT